MTSFLRPDENTLGVIFGRRNKGGPPGVAKALRQASARGATLGTGYLGVGAGVLGAIQALYGLSVFASQWNLYPNPWMAAYAWILYVIAFVAQYAVLPHVDHRYRASLFPGDRLAETVAHDFRKSTGQPLAYVIASMWLGGNIGVYASERPRTVIDGKPARAPWISLASTIGLISARPPPSPMSLST